MTTTTHTPDALRAATRSWHIETVGTDVCLIATTLDGRRIIGHGATYEAALCDALRQIRGEERTAALTEIIRDQRREIERLSDGIERSQDRI